MLPTAYVDCLLTLCEKISLITSGIPSQRATYAAFDNFFVVTLNQLLNTQINCTVMIATDLCKHLTLKQQYIFSQI